MPQEAKQAMDETREKLTKAIFETAFERRDRVETGSPNWFAQLVPQLDRPTGSPNWIAQLVRPTGSPN